MLLNVKFYFQIKLKIKIHSMLVLNSSTIVKLYLKARSWGSKAYKKVVKGDGFSAKRGTSHQGKISLLRTQNPMQLRIGTKLK